MAAMHGELSRRQLLIGAATTLCSGCAHWPEAREGSTRSRRAVVLMAGEYDLLGGAETELALYDDGWAYLWDWDGNKPSSEGRARHLCCELAASEVEGWTRTLDDPALRALPRHYKPEGMVLDGGAAFYGRPGDPFTFANADTTHAPITRMRDRAQALIERLRSEGVDALRDAGLPARARLLARHRWIRDRGAPTMDDLRIYESGLLDYRLIRAHKRDTSDDQRPVPRLREVDPTSLDPLRAWVRDAHSLGPQLLLGDAPHYEQSLLSAGGAFVIVSSVVDGDLPAPLAGLLRELIAFRGYYHDDVADGAGLEVAHR
jgi:hypothetical protein